MDELKTPQKVPAEWIDRIFKRLVEAYGDRFVTCFRSETVIDLERTRWQSALIGCKPEEIKRVLDLCRLGKIKDPPNAIEFFHYCKGNKQPTYTKTPQVFGKEPNRELAKQYLDLLRNKLHGKLTSDGEASLSALDQQVLENSGKPKEKPAHWQDKYD